MPFSTEEKALLSLTPVQRYGLRFFCFWPTAGLPSQKKPGAAPGTGERDHCGWTGKPIKPGRPDTNTYRSKRPMSKKTGLTQSSIIQYGDVGLKGLFRCQLLLVCLTFILHEVV